MYCEYCRGQGWLLNKRDEKGDPTMCPECGGQGRKMTKVDDPLKEEYLNGVPEWQLREDTATYVNQIRDRIKQYIMLNKSNNGADQREAIRAMNDVCDEMELKLYDVLEDSLFSFVRRV